MIKKAREARGLYRCAECKQLVPASLPPPPGKKRRIKNVLADHIDPIVGMEGFVSYDKWIERCFVEEEGWQALCHACHSVKTKEENALRSKTTTGTKKTS